MRATISEGVYLEVIFPSFGTVNEFMKDRLHKAGFVKRGQEFSNVYVFTRNSYSEYDIQEANMIVSDFNTGKKEFTRDYIRPLKKKIQHG